MLVFYTFAIKSSVSTVKLMHQYCKKMELWESAKGCFREGSGERAEWRLTRNRFPPERSSTSQTRRGAETGAAVRPGPTAPPGSQTAAHLGGEDRRSSRKELESTKEDRQMDGRTRLHLLVASISS